MTSMIFEMIHCNRIFFPRWACTRAIKIPKILENSVIVKSSLFTANCHILILAMNFYRNSQLFISAFTQIEYQNVQSTLCSCVISEVLQALVHKQETRNNWNPGLRGWKLAASRAVLISVLFLVRELVYVNPDNTLHGLIDEYSDERFCGACTIVRASAFHLWDCGLDPHIGPMTLEKSSTEKRGFSPGTPVSSHRHRECWQGGLGLAP